LINNILSNGLSYIIKNGGKQISIQYYNQITDDVYDEAVQLVQSGNTLWTSGVVFGLDPNVSEDNILLEQGKIAMSDKRLYTNGSLLYSQLTGSTIQTKIGIGSPTQDFYSLIMLGTDSEEVEDTPIYKKAYIRRIIGGSLIGE